MKNLYFVIILLVSCLTNAAQDSTFQTEGFYYSNKNDAIITTAATQIKDGSMLFAGNFVCYKSTATTNLIRILPNGDLDTTFSADAGTDGYIFNLTAQPDDKVIIFGNFTRYKNSPQRGIARILSNGDIDTSFKPYTPVYGYNNVQGVGLQSDGKIVIAGFALKVSGGFYRLSVIRLNKDGSLDETFNDNAGPDDQYAAIVSNAINTIAIQPDNKIVIGGTFTTWGNKPVTGLTRLEPNGNIDTTFKLSGNGFQNAGTGSQVSINCVKALADTTLLVGGSFTYYNNEFRFGFCKLKKNGELDNAFASAQPFAPTMTRVESMAVLANGDIILGGLFQYNNALNPLVKYTKDGVVNNFGFRLDVDNSGSATNGVKFIFPQQDSSFYASGVFKGIYNNYYVSKFQRFLDNLQPDKTFSNTFQSKGTVRKTLVQEDGKIIVIGDFDIYGTNDKLTRQNVARLNIDGSLDGSFRNVGVSFGVYDITKYSSKILLGGLFSLIGNSITPGLARLNNDGSVDNSLNTGTGEGIYSICTDFAYIYVGGGFSQFNNQPANHVARLLDNGQVDLSFKLSNTELNRVTALALQKDGKLLVGDGDHMLNVNPNYTARLRLYRFDKNGQVDASFITPQLGSTRTLKVLSSSDTSIYWLGELRRINNPNYFENTLIKLKPNGSLDNNALTLPKDYRITDFIILPDSNVIICGQRSQVNDSTSFIMRLKPNLAIDTTFTPVSLYYNIKHLNLMPDGRILVAGEPMRYLRLQKDPINNIALLRNSSIQVFKDASKVNNIIDSASLPSAATGNLSVTTFTIKNTAQTDVSIDAKEIKIKGTDAGDFFVDVTGLKTTLKKGDSVQLKILFKPTVVGNKRANVIIPYNNGLENQYTFDLTAKSTGVTTALPDQPAVNNNFLIYPNPANGHLYIVTQSRFETFQVFTTNGTLIQQGKLPSPQNNIYTIQLNENYKGLLWINLKSGNKTITQKIIRL